jgi:serine/threonine-protein phosphatase 2B regulatory subunit
LNGDGTLTKEEFFSIPEIEKNPLAERVFSIFDTEGNNKVNLTFHNKKGKKKKLKKKVNFKSFLSALSVFNAQSKKDKIDFAFKIYDIDGDGFISNGELFTVLKGMVGDNLNDVQLQQIVDKTIIEADKDGDGKLSLEEFAEVLKENSDVEAKMTIKFSTEFNYE